MEKASSCPTTVRFGVFEADLGARELRRQGIRIRLQEQPFQILQMLLERPGQVVTRRDLRQRIWPADTFVDFDHGLYSAIKKLREALGDSAENPRFIETLAKRGYRFIAPVAVDGTAGASAAQEAAKTSGEPSPPCTFDEGPTRAGPSLGLPLSGAKGSEQALKSGTTTSGAPADAGSSPRSLENHAVIPAKAGIQELDPRIRGVTPPPPKHSGQALRADDTIAASSKALTRNAVWGVFASAALLLGVMLGLYSSSFRQWFQSGTGSPPIRSLAVLPLENLSGDPAQEYFSDGMTDALITDLAQIGSISVISRTSSMQYKQTRKSLPEIAGETRKSLPEIAGEPSRRWCWNEQE
jgi:DNA-binding winged helix-turn-helix (wHTH) protein